MNWYDNFDAIYIISMPNCHERYEKCVKQILKTGIPETKIEKFYAISHVYLEGLKNMWNLNHLSNGEVGCLLSHLSVMQLAIDRQQDKIIVFEDDCLVTRTNAQQMCVEFLDKVDNITRVRNLNWSLLYFGHLPVKKNVLGNYIFAPYEDVKPFLQNGIFQTSDTLKVWGCHAYCIQKPFIIDLVDSFFKDLPHQAVDQRLFSSYLDQPSKYLVVCTYPQIFCQENNFSATTGEQRLYNEYYSGAYQLEM
jgi:GR25 family glycosyltransferase involved in LPS biosynthesis